MALDLDAKVSGDGNRSWLVTTDPTEEPITLSEVKTYARIDGSAENTMLESFIKAVRQATELYLGRSLITQTLTMYLDYWPGYVIELPRPPLVSVNGVYTVDEDDVETEYSSSNYMTQVASEPGELVFKRGVTPPINTDRDYNGYKIVWVAGYGLAVDVPEAIKEAMKFWVAMIYENRVPIADPPDMAKTLLAAYRILPI